MTQDDVRAAWIRVGDELSGLGLKLKYHAEQELAEDDPEVTSALQRLGKSLRDIGDAMDNAAGDDAVREDVRETGRRLMEAMTATIDQAKAELREAKARAEQ